MAAGDAAAVAAEVAAAGDASAEESDSAGLRVVSTGGESDEATNSSIAAARGVSAAAAANRHAYFSRSLFLLFLFISHYSVVYCKDEPVAGNNRASTKGVTALLLPAGGYPCGDATTLFGDCWVTAVSWSRPEMMLTSHASCPVASTALSGDNNTTTAA